LQYKENNAGITVFGLFIVHGLIILVIGKFSINFFKSFSIIKRINGANIVSSFEKGIVFFESPDTEFYQGDIS
jgi:hypothetical protein